MTRLRLIALLCLLPLTATAQTWQDGNAIRRAVAAYAAQYTADLPGEVNVSVGPVEENLRLTACQEMEVFLPAGARLWGNTSLGVRCHAPARWNLFVPLSVKVTADVIAVIRPVPQGHQLTEADLGRQRSDITQYPAGVILDPGQAVGKIVTSSLSAGYPLRADMLKAPLAIQQGQAVKIRALGKGFQVSAEGKALNNAAEGQVVSVKTGSGQVIQGIARPGGLVEVTY